jgi:hypothetical protein
VTEKPKTKENQETVTAWAEEVFGPLDAVITANWCLQEAASLFDIIIRGDWGDDHFAMITCQAAAVAVPMMILSEGIGLDLEQSSREAGAQPTRFLPNHFYRFAGVVVRGSAVLATDALELGRADEMMKSLALSSAALGHLCAALGSHVGVEIDRKMQEYRLGSSKPDVPDAVDKAFQPKGKGRVVH